ncbi:alpha-amylase [Glaciecola sp. MH2013]|uniref:alpha-amylase family glycosyl hydrolase n=1 Tax=Glaciecola sp. MH2013 TaxID=2785524 RepID=UPI00189D80A5|nr:alpha-amylase family glycosyl hydrolase [Glaciecola sp. MH2013]MBF7073309.1 alpha-amylase [Glaciecola sp. MH2013]
MPLPIIPYVKHNSPLWARNASIYQVNTRQFSSSGDFSGVTQELPRIKALGVDIIWLMPIHKIGELNRKGSLGSPYAVKDFYSINPEFGTADDLHALVKRAHELDLKLILDWVPNHSAWDNHLVNQHPNWYARDYKGDFRPCPWWDWDDIIEFDYNSSELRSYMVKAMSYWVEKFDIDGFRCDVAGYVPNDFWRQAREALDAIKPVFMLAEWENRDMHEHAFDMTYAWSWNEVLYDIVQKKQALDKLRKYYSWNERAWPKQAMRMTFISNHDENAWEGTPDEKFGDAQQACIVLSCLGEGMPLIHNGQEAGETKRLAFFEKDPIDWQAHEIGDLYTKLLRLRKRYTALWNAEHGATMIQVPNTEQASIFSFVRQDTESKWFMVFNFTDECVKVSFKESLFIDGYHDALQDAKESIEFVKDTQLTLLPWQYRVFYREH